MKTIVTHPNLTALKAFAEAVGGVFNGSEVILTAEETPSNFATEFIKLGGKAQMHLGTGSEILDCIQRKMKEKGVKVADVARMWGVHKSVASKFLNNTTDRIQRIEQLMDMLDIKLV